MLLSCVCPQVEGEGGSSASSLSPPGPVAEAQLQQQPAQAGALEGESAIHTYTEDDLALVEGALPEMETIDVEVTKDHQGLGITIAGYVCERGEYSAVAITQTALTRSFPLLPSLSDYSPCGFSPDLYTNLVPNTKWQLPSFMFHLRNAMYPSLSLSLCDGGSRGKQEVLFKPRFIPHGERAQSPSRSYVAAQHALLFLSYVLIVLSVYLFSAQAINCASVIP